MENEMKGKEREKLMPLGRQMWLMYMTIVGVAYSFGVLAILDLLVHSACATLALALFSFSLRPQRLPFSAKESRNHIQVRASFTVNWSAS
jgi:hypothetical protein